MQQMAPKATTEPRRLAERFEQVRTATERLCDPLSAEDCVIQSMPDVSPTRWHLAHVTWFFETFLLKPHAADYRPVNDNFGYLFNSYYNAVGEQFPRARRGLLSRPTTRQILDYRGRVDERVRDMLDRGDLTEQACAVLELGLHDDLVEELVGVQQHLELEHHVVDPHHPVLVQGDIVRFEGAVWANLQRL